jgi:hypothetical protein
VKEICVLCKYIYVYYVSIFMYIYVYVNVYTYVFMYMYLYAERVCTRKLETSMLRHLRQLYDTIELNQKEKSD